MPFTALKGRGASTSSSSTLCCSSSWVVPLLALCSLWGCHVVSALEHIDIPSKYLRPPQSSLWCNTCATMVSELKDSLDESDQMFDAMYGFRLDGSGRKIRKHSVALKMSVTMEDMCKDFVKRYRVAVRKRVDSEKSELSSSMIGKDKKSEEDGSDDESNENENEQAKKKRRKGKKQRRRKKKSSSEDDSSYYYLIKQKELDQIDIDIGLEQMSKQKAYDEKVESEGLENITESDTKWTVRRPKLLKYRSKTHKQTKDMCEFITEHLEHWIVDYEADRKKRQSTDIADESEEDRKIRTELEIKVLKSTLDGVCGKEYDFCVDPMFDRTLQYYRVRKQVEERVPELEDDQKDELSEGDDETATQDGSVSDDSLNDDNQHSGNDPQSDTDQTEHSDL